MNLPANPKERRLMIALIAVIAIVIVFVAVQWGLFPLLDYKRKLAVSLLESQEKIRKAKLELDYAPGIQRNFDEIVAQMDKIRTQNILHPILGSYLVGVSEQIEAVARAAGVRVEEIREVGVVSVPRKGKNDAQQTFKSFAVQVNGAGAFEVIGAFLKRMEDRNPFFCVSDIAITGQSDNPELQRFSVRMEWPIEAVGEIKKEGGP